MEEKSKKKLKVLVTLDGSDTSAIVLKRSGQFARVTDCDLTLLHVVERIVVSHQDIVPLEDYIRCKKKAAEELLASAQKTLKDYGVDCKIQVRVGKTASEILGVAEKENFELIIVGSKGLGGIQRMLLGSVADDVIRHAHCSVMVIR